MDQEGNPLDPAALAPFLHGIGPELFDSLHALDHETLVQGGQDILAQKGQAGQALFAAGSGISSLWAVLEQLEQEAAELFKAQGQVPALNQALRRHKDLQKAVKEASLPARDWHIHSQALTRTQSERNDLEKERFEKAREKRRLERLRNALPELAVLDNLNNQLRALGQVILLPPDFSDRLRSVEQQLRDIRLQIAKDRGRLTELTTAFRGISCNSSLLKQATAIDRLLQRLGEFKKSQADRGRLDGLRIGHRRAAAALLQQVRPDLTIDAVESLRPALGKKRTVLDLSRRHEGLSQQLALAQKQARQAAHELEEATRAMACLPHPGDSRELLAGIKLARQAGDLDTVLEKNRLELLEDQQAWTTELTRIGLWQGGLAEAVELPLPLPETVKGFDRDVNDLEDEQRELNKARQTALLDRRNATTELKRLEYACTVPSEAELARLRARRNLGWQLLRRQWLEQQDIEPERLAFDPLVPLPESFERLLAQVDGVADRLRFEADRVAKAADLRARLETAAELLAESDRLQSLLDRRRLETAAAWREQWTQAGIAPHSPPGMNVWLMEFDKLRYKANDILKKERLAAALGLRRHELRARLLKDLAALGETREFTGEALAPVLVAAEALLERLEGEKDQLEKLADRRAKAESAGRQASVDLRVAETGLAEWQQAWLTTLSVLGRQDQLTPQEAADLFETLQECFSAGKQAEELATRIHGIDRDGREFEAEVKALLTALAPDLLAQPLEQALAGLNRLLIAARQDHTRSAMLTTEIEALQSAVQTGHQALAGAEDRMTDLMRIARCEDRDQLATAIRLSLTHEQLSAEIARTATSLARISEGLPLAELQSQAAACAADELPGRIACLTRDLGELDPAINRISQIIGEESNRLAAMDGNARAAEAAEQMERELATIRRLAGRYALVKLAAGILRREIEQYRAEHQDPVLRIASAIFRDLTLNSFAGLRADVNDRAEPILVGIRNDKVLVRVEGMSTGTRDQLYLALRLASLQWRLGSSASLPLIVDDILINFDDDRAHATLKVLTDLAADFQIILFTHHRQVVEDAGRIEAKGSITVHTLG